MDNTVKAFLDKIEAKYERAKADIKEKRADARIEAEKINLDNKIVAMKQKGSETKESAKQALKDAWEQFENKYHQLVK